MSGQLITGSRCEPVVMQRIVDASEVLVTGTGRWVAAGLMVGGIALLGVVTASIASWLIEKVRETEQEAQAATQADVLALAHQIAELRSEIEGLRQDVAYRRVDRS